mmetsp:Transcript_50990/g.148004  ORF Transcript_50990/g.148004 Transcript_50990/m.148004 type:complete len:206 (+) Transcript_50990:71-688(+)
MEQSVQCITSDDKVQATPTLLASRAKHASLSKPTCLSRIQVDEQQVDSLAEPEEESVDTDQDVDKFGELDRSGIPEQDYLSKGRRFSCGESSESSLALKHLMRQRRSRLEQNEEESEGSLANVMLVESPLAARRRFTAPSLQQHVETREDIADPSQGDSPLARRFTAPSLQQHVETREDIADPSQGDSPLAARRDSMKGPSLGSI